MPLEGSRGDILPFSPLLSAGNIDENGIGPKRKSLLCSLYPERAGKGEPVRVWSGDNPDEACGLCWLMEQLRPIGFDALDVTLVRLPAFQERPDGSAVRYTSWGEVEPYQFGRMALLGGKLPAAAFFAGAKQP